MFNTLSFIEGFLLGLVFMLLWSVPFFMDSPRVQRKLEEKQMKKDLLGRPQKAQIIKKEDAIDEMLSETK